MIAEWADHAAKQRPVTVSGRVPFLTTIHRLCVLVDAEALDAALAGWTREKCRPQTIAIDGKEARGAKHANAERVFLMAVLDHGTGCVLGLELVGAKTNEIPHLPALLDQLVELTGVVVTADALHTLAQQAEALPSAQRNFTDPDSRIMKTADGSFHYSYNAQAIVDGDCKVIVAAQLTNIAVDVQQMLRMEETVPTAPGEVLIDAWCCSTSNLREPLCSALTSRTGHLNF